jgi:hypothetical protein
VKVKLILTNCRNPGKTPVLETYYFTFTTFVFRMRAQALVNSPPVITIEENEGPGAMIPIMDVEVRHCAAVIAAAFLNPGKRN